MMVESLSFFLILQNGSDPTLHAPPEDPDLPEYVVSSAYVPILRASFDVMVDDWNITCYHKMRQIMIKGKRFSNYRTHTLSLNWKK